MLLITSGHFPNTIQYDREFYQQYSFHILNPFSPCHYNVTSLGTAYGAMLLNEVGVRQASAGECMPVVENVCRCRGPEHTVIDILSP